MTQLKVIQPNVRISEELARHVFTRAEKIAEETFHTRSEVLRSILYEYYDYIPTHKEQLADVYYHKAAYDPGCWILPVERGFADIYLRDVVSRKGRLSQCYRAAITEPFAQFLSN